MNDQFFNQLIKSISDERLESYRIKLNADDPLAPYACYLWNIALSESLYPSLQAFEVSLRNALHNILTEAYGTAEWFNLQGILAPNQQHILEEIKKRIQSHHHPLTPGQIVANSEFGFWVSLFNRAYEGKFWPRLLAQVFPAMPRRIRTTREVARRVNRIRGLRNRVFHYEPIWRRENLAEEHQGILDAIGWINSSMLAMVQMVDRFQSVYEAGWQRHLDLLSKHINKER